MRVKKDPQAWSYIHGATPEEQQRLSLLNDLLNESSLRELCLNGTETVLDVGSGLGQFTRCMARTGARVLGVERSADQVAEAGKLARDDGEERLVEFREGEAVPLPLEPGERSSFDVAHARFLLEHLSDPAAAVREMVQAVRPGGRVVLADDDHEILRLWPEPSGFMAVWSAYILAYERVGNDPRVGRRLVSLLHEAGAAPLRNTWVFFGSCSGHPAFQGIVENMVKILRGARDGILSTGSVDSEAFDRGVAAFKEWSLLPQSAFWFAMCWAEGVRRSTASR